jgi:uncharacterized protein with HEPN domain
VRAREAYDLIATTRRDQYEVDTKTQYAIRYLLVVIGEAASKVSKSTTARYPEIEWPRITGMRHRLVHGYTQVSGDIIWDTAQGDLPPLIAELERIAP